MSIYKNLVKSLKSKQLHISIPLILFMTYTAFIYIIMFIEIFNGDNPTVKSTIEPVVDFWISYSPQFDLSSTPGVILNVLWTIIFCAFPTIIAWIVGALIIFRCLAYLFGLIGHFFLFLKKWILDMQDF